MKGSRWDIMRAAICGAMVGTIWVGWQVIESGVPWTGEGLYSNVNEIGGGVAGGAALGMIVVLIRNRFVR